MTSIAKPFATCLGFSIYSANPYQDTVSWIKDYATSGFSFAFSSLNIPEEDTSNYHQIIELCHQYSIRVFVDINQSSFERYGVSGLQSLGIEVVRLDDGIDLKTLKLLANNFRVVLNASTLTEDYLSELLANDIDLHTIIACHNYYPKPYTGLNLERVRDLNQLLHHYRIPTISFIAGDTKRFPIFEGLPTIESQRVLKPLQAAVESMVAGESDYICIGDNALSKTSLEQMTYLSQGIIPLSANVMDELKGIVFENRVDASDYVIRAADSRSQLKTFEFKGHEIARNRGAIVVANRQFLRYQNELEICLTKLPKDVRQSVVGQVNPDSLALLDYIKSPLKFTFV